MRVCRLFQNSILNFGVSRIRQEEILPFASMAAECVRLRKLTSTVCFVYLIQCRKCHIHLLSEPCLSYKLQQPSQPILLSSCPIWLSTSLLSSYFRRVRSISQWFWTLSSPFQQTSPLRFSFMPWLLLALKSNQSGRTGPKTTSLPTPQSDPFRCLNWMAILVSSFLSIASVHRTALSFPRLLRLHSMSLRRLTSFSLAAVFRKASPANFDGCFLPTPHCLSKNPISTICTPFCRHSSRWFRYGTFQNGQLNYLNRFGTELNRFTLRCVPILLREANTSDWFPCPALFCVRWFVETPRSFHFRSRWCSPALRCCEKKNSAEKTRGKAETTNQLPSNCFSFSTMRVCCFHRNLPTFRTRFSLCSLLGLM